MSKFSSGARNRVRGIRDSLERIAVTRGRWLVLGGLCMVPVVGCKGDTNITSNNGGTGQGAAGSGAMSGAAGASGHAGSAGLGGASASGGVSGSNGTSGEAGASAGTSAAGASGMSGIAGSAAAGGAGGAGGAGSAGMAGDAAGTESGGTSASPMPRSCEGLSNDCGLGHDDDCCSMASKVLGGETFYRDWDAANDPGTTKMYPGKVSDFWLGKYEVTVGRFRSFVNGYTSWRAAGHPMTGEGGDPNVSPSSATAWDAQWNDNLPESAADFSNPTYLSCAPTATWTEDGMSANDNKPINCVSWYVANAFCLWDGGWLPTESEWMYAAVGGQNRVFPWSSPPEATLIDADHASYGHQSVIENVGSHPEGAGIWGHMDLAGSEWEWCSDWMNVTFSGEAGQLCTNCFQPTPDVDNHRTERGGAHGNTDIQYLRSAFRGHADPSIPDEGLGIRCAYAP